MQELSWNYFLKTGDVDAYMLYRDLQEPPEEEESEGSDGNDIADAIPSANG